MEDFIDNKREKENTIIFVEGISDLAFLSLLMNKWKGYTYVRKIIGYKKLKKAWNALCILIKSII